MFELRLRIDRWLTDPDRAFMRGTDVHGFLRWHGVNVDALSAGELVRLAALLRVFEEHPREAASLTTDALWCTVGDYGCRGRHALASVGVARDDLAPLDPLEAAGMGLDHAWRPPQSPHP